MKRALKHEIFEKRRALSKEDVKEKSLKVKENLFSLEEFKKAKNIMFYVSFKNEVGTHEMIKELIAKKEKTVIVPYVLENYPILQLSELKNFYWLEPRTFGVLEPKELYIREFNHEKVDLVIVPGIVFDKKGYRIGYGHGYYDKFLKILKKGVKIIGLAFELQIVDEVPEEEHDVPVDCVVTEERVLKC
ncbi:MAG: 5-formyltetrahydrofolate cyclo-ligase [Candidatus Woesearchaeota archaeon]